MALENKQSYRLSYGRESSIRGRGLAPSHRCNEGRTMDEIEVVGFSIFHHWVSFFPEAPLPWFRTSLASWKSVQFVISKLWIFTLSPREVLPRPIVVSFVLEDDCSKLFPQTYFSHILWKKVTSSTFTEEMFWITILSILLLAFAHLWIHDFHLWWMAVDPSTDTFSLPVWDSLDTPVL